MEDTWDLPFSIGDSIADERWRCLCLYYTIFRTCMYFLDTPDYPGASEYHTNRWLHWHWCRQDYEIWGRHPDMYLKGQDYRRHELGKLA